jgi:hypothetical protein
MTFKINITNSGVTTTIIPDIGFMYELNLNEVNEAQLKFSGTSIITRTVFKIGAKVEIFRNNIIEFIGVVDMKDNVNGGGVVVHISGFESYLKKEFGAYANSPYSNTASATIFDDILSDTELTSFYTVFSKCTIATGFNIDARYNESTSFWSALTSLANTTQQDIDIDYVNAKINIVNHLGSSTSIGIYNDGIDINNLRFTDGFPEANFIKVYGKGEGSSQKYAEKSDAVSIATYGKIVKVITDRTLLSDSQCLKVAESELAISKEPIEYLDFDFNNSLVDVNLGDIITVNSPDKDLNSKDMRIIKIVRGEQGDSDILTIQVANSTARDGIKDRNKLIANINETNIRNNSYKQGFETVTSYSTSDSLNNDKSMFLDFEVGNIFTDEIGNLTIESIELDYALDKFVMRGSSSVNESDRDPAYSGNTSSHDHNVNSPSHDHTNPTATSNKQTDDVNYAYDSLGAAVLDNGSAAITVTVPTVGSNVTDNAFHIIHFSYSFFTLGSVDPDDIQVRIRNLDISSNLFLETLSNIQQGDSGSTSIIEGDDTYGGDEIELRIYNNTGGTMDVFCTLTVSAIEKHTHSVSLANTNTRSASINESTRTPSYSGNVDTHNHAVSLSAGSISADDVNGSSVTIVLQEWNGATWDDLNTETYASIFETELSDFDGFITDTGTYRFKINTNSADFDNSRFILRIKHIIGG